MARCAGAPFRRKTSHPARRHRERHSIFWAKGAGRPKRQETRMTTAIYDLKARARILHRRALSNDPAALERIGPLDAPLHGRHSLADVAKEAAFRGWPHPTAVLGG